MGGYSPAVYDGSERMQKGEAVLPSDGDRARCQTLGNPRLPAVLVELRAHAQAEGQAVRMREILRMAHCLVDGLQSSLRSSEKPQRVGSIKSTCEPRLFAGDEPL